VKARRFLTIDIALQEEETDPTGTVINAICNQQEKVSNAIVRLNITLPSSLEGRLRSNDIKEALKEAHNYTVSRTISRETRLRIGSRPAEDITPRDALKAYFEMQKIPPERQKVLLEYGEKLIGES
jgi:exonuclease SbcD